MKFTLVTISYNQAEYLEEAINSVLQQEYKNIEYIIVDPGSTDGSRKIIKKYSDRITKIILEPDNGPADALNKGFKYATGDIYGFLNSDDLLMPGAISTVANEFLKYPNIDVISGSCMIINDKSSVIRRAFSDNFNKYMSAYSACILIQPSTFFKSAAYLSTNGFNPENKSNWDSELYIDMALKNAKFKNIDNLLSCYRVHKQSITGSKRLEDLHKIHDERMFIKITKRKPNVLDKLIKIFARYSRKLINPKDTVERIMHGSIFGNYK